MRCHTLKHRRGTNVEGDTGRKGNDPIGWNRRPLGIRADRTRVGNAIAYSELVHSGTDLDHIARRLQTRGERQLHRIEPRSLVRVDEVETCRSNLNHDLAGTGGRFLDLLGNEDLGPTQFGYHGCSHRYLQNDDDTGLPIQVEQDPARAGPDDHMATEIAPGGATLQPI